MKTTDCNIEYGDRKCLKVSASFLSGFLFVLFCINTLTLIIVCLPLVRAVFRGYRELRHPEHGKRPLSMELPYTEEIKCAVELVGEAEETRNVVPKGRFRCTCIPCQRSYPFLMTFNDNHNN